jgi:NAD(P)-dependent dehydrogenase (short-subunit alcohol dehydrogenase family)
VKNELFSLEGRNIIVTGASSGIGRECAVTCSRQGARLILLGRNIDRLNETKNLIGKNNKFLTYTADLTDYLLIEGIMKEIVGEIGKIDGLVNCAGVTTTLPFNLAKPEKIEEIFKTNVQAAMNITRIATKQSNFSINGGSIIFISSVMGEAGEIGKSIYSLTKGALIALSKSLALEMAPRRIRINCISPGVVESPMSKRSVYSRDEESYNKIIALHPLGIGQPEEVANACVYLLSDASKWVTGTNMIVDGGYLAR